MKSAKESYLKEPRGEEKLAASDLPPITKHYKEKYNITIIINGESQYGESIIKSHEKELEEVLQLNKDPLKYALYFKKYWLAPGLDQKIEKWYIADRPPSNHEKDYLKLRNLIKDFLDEKGNLRDLSNSELEALNETITFNPIKSNMDAQIRRLPSDMGCSNKCLNLYQAIEEVSYIQNRVNNSKAVGYVYTNNNRLEKDHFEVLIIAPNNLIIKPVVWRPEESKVINLKNGQPHTYASADISNFVDKPILAQADATEVCGTLGILYLKELLKDNGQQLEKYSLIIPYYDNNGSKYNLFIPSPHTLRYSHSELYNLTIETMVSSDSLDPITVNNNNRSILITPIRSIIEKNREIALSKGDTALVNEYNRLQQGLQLFRENWLKENQKAKLKRELMKSSERNIYLGYKSVSIKDRANSEKDQKAPVNHANLFIPNKKINPITLDSYIKIYTKLDEIYNNIFDVLLKGNYELRPVLNLAMTLKDLAREYEKNQDYNKLDLSLSEAINEVRKIKELSEALKKYELEDISQKIRDGAQEHQVDLNNQVITPSNS